jgi:drug/metabolite transporter (DMT)-like permease
MTTAARTIPSTSAFAHSSRILVLAAFFAIYVVWGSTYLAIRFAIESIPPLVTAGIRHTTAGLVLLAWAYARGFRFRMEYLKGALALGILFFVIGHGTLHWAEQYVNSGLAALLIATEPLFILVIGSLMGTESVNWKNGLGLILGLLGVFLLTGRDLWDHSSLSVGIAAVLVGSVSWAIGVCLSPRLKLPDEPVARAALPVICGGPLLLLIAAVSGEMHRLHWSGVSARSIAGLAYLIVFGSIVAFTAYMWLLQRIPPTLVATHTYVNPVVAILLGWLLASEPLTARLIAAAVAILAAIVLIQQGTRAQSDEQSAKRAA